MKISGVDFNQEWASKKTKTQFVKEFTGVYPQFDDKALEVAYDALTKKEDEVKKDGNAKQP